MDELCVGPIKKGENNTLVSMKCSDAPGFIFSDSG